MPRLLLLLAACLALVLGACGSSGGDPDADPAAVVPARAPVYLEANLKPEGDLADAVDQLAQKLGGVDDLGAEIKRLIEQDAREDDKDFSYKDDIEPWLGDRVAIFFHDISGTDDEPQGALVLATKDPDKARDAFEENLTTSEGGKPGKVVDRTYRDVDYKLEQNDGNAFAMLDDFVVFGDESGVKAAIDASEAESLSEADAFKQSRDQVPDDGLGFGYLAMRQLFSGLGPEAAALRPLLSSLGDTIALSLGATPDSIRLDAAALGVSGPAGAGPGEVLPSLPGDAWLAFGTADLGGTVSRALKQIGQLGALGGVDIEQQLREQLGIDIERDVTSWMGDAGIFAMGSSLSDIGGGVVIAVKDRERALAAMPKLVRLLRSTGSLRVTPLRVDGVEAGVRLRSEEVPVPIDVGITEDDRFVIAGGSGAFEAAASSSGEKLGDAAAFKDAQAKLGDGIKPSFFVDIAPVRELISGLGLENQGEAGKRFARALDALTTIAAGGRRDGEIARGRVVVGVK